MSNIDKQALRERYSLQPVPKCHICDAVMTIARASAGAVVYACSGCTYDDNGAHYAPGRSLGDDHYSASRVTIFESGDSDVLALLDELEALQSFRTAFNEWHDKTEWVQGDKRFDVIKPWGKHRADVLKLYIDHLESKLEAAEKQNADYLARLDRLERRCDHQGSVYWDASGVKRCARCGIAAGIGVKGE